MKVGRGNAEPGFTLCGGENMRGLRTRGTTAPAEADTVSDEAFLLESLCTCINGVPDVADALGWLQKEVQVEAAAANSTAEAGTDRRVSTETK